MQGVWNGQSLPHSILGTLVSLVTLLRLERDSAPLCELPGLFAVRHLLAASLLVLCGLLELQEEKTVDSHTFTSKNWGPYLYIQCITYHRIGVHALRTDPLCTSKREKKRGWGHTLLCLLSRRFASQSFVLAFLSDIPRGFSIFFGWYNFPYLSDFGLTSVSSACSARSSSFVLCGGRRRSFDGFFKRNIKKHIPWTRTHRSSCRTRGRHPVQARSRQGHALRQPPSPHAHASCCLSFPFRLRTMSTLVCIVVLL